MSNKQIIVYLKLTPKSESQLTKYANDNHLDISTGYNGGKDKFEFHLTVICSKEPCDLKREKSSLSRKIVVKPQSIGLLGMKDSLVLFVNDGKKDLERIRNIFEKFQKINPTFVTFIPHISLSYNWNKKDRDFSTLPLPNFDIEFNEIVIDDFDPPEQKLTVVESIVQYLKKARMI